MKNLVIVSFPAKAENLGELKESMRAALPTLDLLMDVYQLILILKNQQIQYT